MGPTNAAALRDAFCSPWETLPSRDLFITSLWCVYMCIHCICVCVCRCGGCGWVLGCYSLPSGVWASMWTRSGSLSRPDTDLGGDWQKWKEFMSWAAVKRKAFKEEIVLSSDLVLTSILRDLVPVLTAHSTASYRKPIAWGKGLSPDQMGLFGPVSVLWWFWGWMVKVVFGLIDKTVVCGPRPSYLNSALQDEMSKDIEEGRRSRPVLCRTFTKWK